MTMLVASPPLVHQVDAVCGSDPSAALLTPADCSLIADLCGDLSDEQGRLTVHAVRVADGLSLSDHRQIHLGYRLHVVVERLARHHVDGEHFLLTQMGTPLEVASWVEQTMLLLADARAIVTPVYERNDICPMPSCPADGVDWLCTAMGERTLHLEECRL